MKIRLVACPLLERARFEPHFCLSLQSATTRFTSVPIAKRTIIADHKPSLEFFFRYGAATIADEPSDRPKKIESLFR